ncbi:MAG: alkaline phosphatase family protein [Solirubrobacteraceae bacterium]
MTDDQALDRLRQIKHIVVVMMENRSFDHMLGYLSLPDAAGVVPNAEINGLTGPDVNFNLGPDGTRIPITPFDADGNEVQRRGEALQKSLDPDHSPHGVATQLGAKGADGAYPMDGFVRAFASSRNPTAGVGKDLWIVPMGYYTGKDLPAYDFLARNYCVCDNWHSSIPGDTWPNRLYSLAATNAEAAREDFFEKIKHLFASMPLGNAPIFNVRTFTHELQPTQWRWYSHDPATLRAADGYYRDLDKGLMRGNFAYFDRKKMSFATEALEDPIVGHDSFLDDAAKGQLRDVSWIDPNFIDLRILDPNSNDDHPPTDIRAGQAFILEIYDALARSPHWEDTMLVVVYDEHGGFYDHVSPPPVDDGSGYPSLGVRVPAMIVGPRVSNTVCHETLDHTVLIKTILTRFAADPDQAAQRMGTRVQNAEHLGIVLEDAPRAGIPAHDEVRSALDDWRTKARADRRAAPDRAPSPAPDGAGRPLVLHDFQEDFGRFALAMRHLLPPSQP